MPIGFKNRTDGNVQVAVDAVRAAAAPHAFAGIDDSGTPAILHTDRQPRRPRDPARRPRRARTTTPPGSRTRSSMLRAAGLPERLVIDASHDNSGKDPAKQVVAAGEIADQIAAGNGAIVGVMLESFLVEGRQDLDGERAAHLRPVDHRRLHRLGGRPSRCSTSSAAAVAGAARRMRIAVLGVGLIGGSIGLAARERLGRRGGRLRPRPGDARAGGRARGDRPRRRARRGGLRRAPRSSSAPRRWRRCRSWPRRRSRPAGPRRVVTDVGSTKRELVAALGDDERFIGGHPLAGAETAGVENARADLFEGARWYLTPTERSSGLLYDRLQRAVAGLGARPQAIDAEAHDRLMATVSHLPHVRRQRPRRPRRRRS